MLKNETIIINTSMPLRNYMKRRPTHYAEILSKNNRVINVSSAPLADSSKYREICAWEEKIYFRLPGNRFKIIQLVNQWRYKKFFKRLIYNLPNKPILWNFYSGNFDIVNSLPNKTSILEICDDTPAFFSNNPEQFKKVKNNEDKMTAAVDIVFTISDYLLQKKKKTRPDIQLMRNGVVYDDFKNIPQLSKRTNDELHNIKSPIVGYTGAVSNWFDFNLVEKLAQNLTSVNFVYIGRIAPGHENNIKRLNEYRNIFFIGEKQYKDLPDYIKYFDIAQIPFVMNELVASVNPIKLYEYLAGGKRVVSTPMPEVVFYQQKGIVETASSADEYSEIIQKYLMENSEDYVTQCQKIAKKNSWEERVNSASKIIQHKLGKKI